MQVYTGYFEASSSIEPFDAECVIARLANEWGEAQIKFRDRFAWVGLVVPCVITRQQRLDLRESIAAELEALSPGLRIVRHSLTRRGSERALRRQKAG